MPVTMFKHLPFNTRKTAHLDRLCLEISSKTVGPNVVDCLSVYCKKYIKIKQTQMFCYSVCYK